MTTAEIEVTKQVEVSKLVEPKFLTLTGRPANQVAFKIVRDDSKGDLPVTQANPTDSLRRRRTRSTQRSALLYITFPTGTTTEAIAATAQEYGLEGYEVSTQTDGSMCLKRSDVTDTAGAVTVKIGEGRVAGIARTEASTLAVQDPMPHIAVIAIEFNKENYPNNDAALAYLQRYDIDFLEKGIENTDTSIRVVRSEPVAEQETRRMEVEKGVVVVVARSATQDVGPAMEYASPFTEVVSETAYGNWGWGQLDFAAAMADVELCESTREAMRRFEGVVDRIMFYSELPIAVRKELIGRAAAQFTGYVSTLMDALPAKLVLINRSSLEKRKELNMTTATKDTGTVKQTASQRTDAPATATTPPVVETPVTRAEIATIVSEAVTAALAAQATQRSEPATVPAATPVVPATPAPAADGETKILDSVEQVITRSVSGLTDAVKSLGDRLTHMESTTTVRSDNVDSGTAAAKDPFTGIFGKTFQ